MLFCLKQWNEVSSSSKRRHRKLVELYQGRLLHITTGNVQLVCWSTLKWAESRHGFERSSSVILWIFKSYRVAPMNAIGFSEQKDWYRPLATNCLECLSRVIGLNQYNIMLHRRATMYRTRCQEVRSEVLGAYGVKGTDVSFSGISTQLKATNWHCSQSFQNCAILLKQTFAFSLAGNTVFAIPVDIAEREFGGVAFNSIFSFARTNRKVASFTEVDFRIQTNKWRCGCSCYLCHVKASSRNSDMIFFVKSVFGKFN